MSIRFLVIFGVLALAGPVCAQSTSLDPPAPPAAPAPSVADVARQNRAKPKSGKVIGNDEIGEMRPSSVIPVIRTTGLENTEAVVKAIDDYRKSHTPEETEELVRSWYEDHDTLILHALEENARIDEEQPQNFHTPEEYRLWAQQRQYMAARRKENMVLIQRIQSAFSRVRTYMQKNQISWAWFRLRCGGEYCQ